MPYPSLTLYPSASIFPGFARDIAIKIGILQLRGIASNAFVRYTAGQPMETWEAGKPLITVTAGGVDV